MKNNNKSVIRKITSRSLRSDRQRNIFIIAAVALTTLLLASVFSVGMSIMESYQTQQVRLMGSIGHAAVTRPSAEELEQIKALDFVDAVGTGNNVAEVINTPEMGDLSLSFYHYDKTEWEEMRAPAYQNIIGEYPTVENEIIMPIWVLQRMGIEPELGMEIPISYRVDKGDGNYEYFDEIFILSGWYTSYMHIRSGNIESILVSEVLSRRHGRTIADDGAAYLKFKNNADVTGYCERVESALGITDPQRVRAVPMYNFSDSDSASTFLALAAICAFLILTGYLLIYNVLYISVSKDVRFYGLLKTVGTTSRQIRRIVTGQVLRLCVIGIPIGLAISAILSLAIVPALVNGLNTIPTGTVVSFSPIIYIGAAAFAILTAFLGAARPAKTAASVSPVEAEKYTEKVNGKARFQTRGKPHRMAVRNIFRDKKRAVVVLLSLFLGLTTFLTITTIVMSMDTDNYVDSYMEHDFELNNNTADFVKVMTDGTESKQKFDAGFLEEMKNLPGFEAMHYRTEDMLALTFDDRFIPYLSALEDWGITEETQNNWKENGGFTSVAIGIDSTELADIDASVDAEAFARGEFLLLLSDEPSLLEGIDSVEIRSWPGNEVIDNIPVGGYINRDVFGQRSAAPTIVMSNSLMDKLVGGEAHRTDLHIDVSEGYDQEFLDSLSALTEDDFEISRTSRIEARQEMRDTRMLLFILGGGIALVLGLIGILNFVNVMSVGVLVRKRELATLEAMGMTRRQLRKMLLCEGIGYAVISLLSVLILGSAVTYGVFVLFVQQAAYAVFTYPVIPAFITTLVIIAVCLATPEVIYRGIAKSAVVERLRGAE